MAKDAPTDELSRLENDLLEARKYERDLDHQQRAAGGRVQQLEAELVELARTDPAQLDGTGQPKPKTAAAKLAAEIQALRSPAVSWASRRGAGTKRTRSAQTAIHRFKAEHPDIRRTRAKGAGCTTSERAAQAASRLPSGPAGNLLPAARRTNLGGFMR